MPVKRTYLVAASLTLCALVRVGAQSGSGNGEWRSYGGDLGHTRYSPLEQIDASNFNKLEIAWRFKTDNLGPRPEFQFESTPLMVNGVLYSTAGIAPRRRRARRRRPASCSGCTARTRARAARRRRVSSRAAASRTGPTASDERILYVTPGYRLIALDAKTGAPVHSFGKNGVVDLKHDDDQEIDLDHRRDRPAFDADGREERRHRRRRASRPAAIRRAGATRKATSAASTCAPASGSGSSTRFRSPASSATTRGKRTRGPTPATRACGRRSRSTKSSGLVYLPVELPTGDYYGGHRPGNGLFGESLVAVDLQTGQAAWHYQLVHHGIWDMDIPCAPILVDITVNGRPIKARGAADQAGVPLRVQSRDRRADLADRRAAGGERRRAWRVVRADAAVSDQAARLRSPGRRRSTI